MEEGSEEAKKKLDQLWEHARDTVHYTVNAANEMKSRGELTH